MTLSWVRKDGPVLGVLPRDDSRNTNYFLLPSPLICCVSLSAFVFQFETGMLLCMPPELFGPQIIKDEAGETSLDY